MSPSSHAATNPSASAMQLAAALVLDSRPGQELASDARALLQARVAALTERLDRPRYGGHPPAVDFPSFVAALVRDLYRALSGSTVEQVRAFQDLVSAAALAAEGPERRLLHTLTLMGLQHITVSSGELDARLRLLLDEAAAQGQQRLGLTVMDADQRRLHETGRVAIRFHSEVMPVERFISPSAQAALPRLGLRA